MFVEKRRYPRVKQSLPIKLCDNEYDIVTETKNISGNGVYCAVNRKLPLMTKLKIILLIPLRKNNRKILRKITCNGIVVRQAYMKNNGKYSYDTGIYFNEIKESDRKVILSYIDTSLKKTF